MSIQNPTPYPEVNTLIQVLIVNVQGVLANRLVGMYLDGSLAGGDFDEDSDIDFVAVTDDDVSGDFFLALQAMHDRIATLDSPWAIQLEGSYVSRHALGRYDPSHALHPNIERGRGERLKMVDHNDWWVIHRYILRERGITLAGPAPKTLIDPILPAHLRRAMRGILLNWATPILDNPDKISNRGYQSYTVLSLCRILYTLQQGTVVSKHVAARWVQENHGPRWESLIQRAWVGRHNPQLQAEPADVEGTLDLLRYTLERDKMSDFFEEV